MKQLHHQAGKPFKRSWYTHSRADFNQYALCRVYVYLQFSSLVDGGVEQGEETLEEWSGDCKLSARRLEAEVVHPNLVSNVGPGITNVSIHFAHDADVLVAI